MRHPFTVSKKLLVLAGVAITATAAVSIAIGAWSVGGTGTG
jgi:hypothetical protein